MFTTLRAIKSSKAYPVSNRDAIVYELNPNMRVLLTRTANSSQYNDNVMDMSINLDNVEKVDVVFQDYKPVYKNDARIINKDRSDADNTDYLTLIITEKILTDPISEKLPMITSYHFENKVSAKEIGDIIPVVEFEEPEPVKLSDVDEKEKRIWSGKNAIDWEKDRYKNKDEKERSQMNRKIREQK